MLNIMEVLLMSNEASWNLQCKVWDNQDKLDESVNNYEKAKAMHSLIHNLVEAYKLDQRDTISTVWEELFNATYWIGELDGGTKVY